MEARAHENAGEKRHGQVMRLLSLVKAFPSQRVTVLGDMVADEFVSGEISRVSREAPVLILKHLNREYRPGGGANAVNNLAALGARVLPVGVLGEDEPGEFLWKYFRERGVDTSGLIRAHGRVTPTKTRFLAGWSHKMAQQVLRVDREPAGALPPAMMRQLRAKAKSRAAGAGAVLISDYGFGAATPELAATMRSRRKVLDSRYALLKFAGSKITAATPNEPELEAAYGERVGANLAKLETLGKRTLRAMRLEALLVTRGKDGMALFERGQRVKHFAAFGAEDAVDVTGAGDTVIAVFTLALAAGATYAEAALLANYAGGIVVMKRGTATVTRGELAGAVRSGAAQMAAGTAAE